MIDLSSLIEYVPLEKQMLLDAQKYVERAEMYLAIGKLKHCIGCLAKAVKKLEKAEQFKLSELSIDSLNFMRPLLDLLAKQIDDSITKKSQD